MPKKSEKNENDSNSSTKNILRETHKLGSIPIKPLNDYSVDPDRKKTSGTKPGGWYSRPEDSTKSKKSKWLFKVGGGYELNIESRNLNSNTSNKPNSFLQTVNISNELNAIKEAYSGGLYKIFLPDNTPKTRLIVNNHANGDIDSPGKRLFGNSKYGLASKEIVGFTEFPINPPYEFIEKYGKQITKVLITALLLGESDLKSDNIGYSPVSEKFYKIDHGESMRLQNSINKHYNVFHVPFDPAYISADILANWSGLDKRFFTEQNIENAFKEILAVDFQQLEDVSKKYEPILDQYRNINGSSPSSLIGSEPNTLSRLISERFSDLIRCMPKYINTSNTKKILLEAMPDNLDINERIKWKEYINNIPPNTGLLEIQSNAQKIFIKSAPDYLNKIGNIIDHIQGQGKDSQYAAIILNEDIMSKQLGYAVQITLEKDGEYACKAHDGTLIHISKAEITDLISSGNPTIQCSTLNNIELKMSDKWLENQNIPTHTEQGGDESPSITKNQHL